MKLRQQYQTFNKGFTLIEVLIAIFVSSIVLGVLYASFFQIVKAKDTVEAELELYHESRVVFSKLTEDLAGIFPRGKIYTSGSNRSSRSGRSSDSGDSPSQPAVPVTTEEKTFVGIKDGEQSAVKFTSLSGDTAYNTVTPDQTEISYFVEPIPGTDLFALIRRENPRIGTDSTGTQYPISERIVMFDLAYLVETPRGREFVEEWDSAGSGSIPKAVDVRLAIRDSRGEDIVFSSLIPIPVAR